MLALFLAITAEYSQAGSNQYELERAVTRSNNER